jgi:hypothetical protein
VLAKQNMNAKWPAKRSGYEMWGFSEWLGARKEKRSDMQYGLMRRSK